MLSLADAPSRRDPQAVALVHGDERWSWGALDRRSAAWAARLREARVKPDDLVAFAFPNGPDFLALVFGVYRVGAERRATPDGWETVGDMGWLDADGYLFLADRRADLIISGGVNIWPAEVEAAVLRHPAIRSCAVVGRADDDLGERVHAILETDDAGLDLAALREFLTPHLSRIKHPRSLEIQTAPVRDDAGKARKSLMRGTPL